MKTLKLNFTVPEDVANKLKTRVGKRKRSAFVVEAVRARLEELEKERLQNALVEGYQARRREEAEADREWESATLEKWE